jgi:hypothetical protein
MQLITLLSLINTRIMPTNLLQYYNAMSLASLEFLPNIIDFFVNPENNELPDNAKYHPSKLILTS